MIPLSIICLALVGALVYAVRQAATDRKEWALERGALLQRIQAPERAVIEQAGVPEREPLPYIPLDDDAAFEALREARHGRTG